MDWIEKIFGLSPDNGDGSTEAMIVAVCCAVVVLAIVIAVPALRERARHGVGILLARYRQ